MTNSTVRAWKDPEYRAGMAVVPAHPAGEADLRQVELQGLDLVGGAPMSGAICAITKTITLPNPAVCVITLSIC